MYKAFCDLCEKELPHPEDVYYTDKYKITIFVHEKDNFEKMWVCQNCLNKLLRVMKPKEDN